MCKILLEVFFLIVMITVAIIAGHPTANDKLMFIIGDDTAVVESTVRETRAVVPEHIEDLLKPGVKEAFLHSYGDKEKSDGDVNGYRKTSQDKGNDGYKHFDTYHKKDGDKYGYETHSEYGQENRAKADNKQKSAKYSLNHGDKEGAATKNSYKITEHDGGRKNHVQSLESYDDGDDYGFYGESYFKDAADDDDGGDKESEGYEVNEGYEEEDGDSGDSGESGSYTEEAEEEGADDGDIDAESYDEYEYY